MKNIKQEFMAYRNGIIADTLREAGWPHKVIFGLNLPQITDIARQLAWPDTLLALSLWEDREVRESRLLASFLFPYDMDIQQIMDICADLCTREEADLLAFRWLRNHNQASQIANQLSEMENTNALMPYLASAVRRFHK